MQVELAIFDPPKNEKRLDRLNQLYWLVLSLLKLKNKNFLCFDTITICYNFDYDPNTLHFILFFINIVC